MFSAEEIEESRTGHIEAVARVPRRRCYFLDYQDFKTGFSVHQRTGGPRGRRDVSTTRVINALSRSGRALSGRDLRGMTGIKKTTLELVLLRLRRFGRVVRIPSEWNGPSADYVYGLAEGAAEASR